MRKVIYAPSRYYQGDGELKLLSFHVEKLGKKAFILVDPYILDHYETYITDNFKTDYQIVKFSGECSYSVINHYLNDVIKDEDVIVGIGGGKTLDTAKAIAYYKKIPVIICPTAASSDAPCSALSIIYSDEGVCVDGIFYDKNPDVVLVDTSIIANAPVRLLAAGMGDAIATFYEMRSNYRAQLTIKNGGKVSRTAYAIAEACKNILFNEGYTAFLSAKNHVLTLELDNVIEANIYMSGIGFESGGCAVAHGIHDALTTIEDTHHCLHGEKVAFGTICQLVLENAPFEEIQKVIEFCKSIGLPTTFKDLGITENVQEKIKKVAQSCNDSKSLVHNCAVEVNADLVYATMMTVNELGQR